MKCYEQVGVPVLGLVQLNRGCEKRHDKRPIMSDLRGSGGWEQNADGILFVYRDEVYHPDTEFPNVAEIIMAKNRVGKTGIASVFAKMATAQFVGLEVRTEALEY
jgi:replicative DNA helicase